MYFPSILWAFAPDLNFLPETVAELTVGVPDPVGTDSGIKELKAWWLYVLMIEKRKEVAWCSENLFQIYLIILKNKY